MNPANDPLVRALIEDLGTATNLEAGEIALAIQRVVRGENLEDTNPELAAKYKEYLADVDADADEYVRNKEAFITTALDEAVQLTEEQKAKLNQQTAKKFAYYKQQARMNSREKQRWMQDQLEHGPKVKVFVEPKVVMGSIGGQPASEIQGCMIRISGVSVYLQPGWNETHPIIAERYEQIQRSAEGTLKRKQVLQGVGIQSEGWKRGQPDGWQQTARKLAAIDSEYGSTGEGWDDPTLHRNF